MYVSGCSAKFLSLKFVVGNMARWNRATLVFERKYCTVKLGKKYS